MAYLKNPTKEQLKKYKMTKREFFEQFDNLSEKELNKKSNKNVYVRNVFMTVIIKRCRGETKRGVGAIDGFGKKITIPDSEISEFEVQNLKSNQKQGSGL